MRNARINLLLAIEAMRGFFALGVGGRGDVQTSQPGPTSGGPASFSTVTASGQFLAADGAVGAPAYAFTSSASTGMWLLASTIRWSLGRNATQGEIAAEVRRYMTNIVAAQEDIAQRAALVPATPIAPT